MFTGISGEILYVYINLSDFFLRTNNFIYLPNLHSVIQISLTLIERIIQKITRRVYILETISACAADNLPEKAIIKEVICPASLSVVTKKFLAIIFSSPLFFLSYGYSIVREKISQDVSSPWLSREILSKKLQRFASIFISNALS